MKITSKDNPKIKELIKLAKANYRKKTGLFVIEGTREIEMALKQGIAIKEIFLCTELLADIKTWHSGTIQTTELSPAVFTAVAYKEKPEGILAIAEMHRLQLSEIILSPAPLVLVLEKVEKPGNLGAILRTAFAARIDAVIINDPQTDIYNPNVIRSSMGHLFSNQVAVASATATIAWLKEHRITTYATAITAKHDYSQVDYQKGTALVMGTENSGLSDHWLKAADKQILIPMQAGIDSLNVSVSTAIITYEALRQRQFPNHVK
ncbi:MAG: RNA methyltransferase [Candidatus Falkowbacteria bacterium]